MQQQRPNHSKAAAVAQILQRRQAFHELQQCGLKYLIGYEWEVTHPEMGRRVWGMLFTDSSGGFLVLEAKGSSNSRVVAQQQAIVLTQILRSKYPGHEVYAAVRCPTKSTAWEWVQNPDGAS
jgi:hypothetical protein